MINHIADVGYNHPFRLLLFLFVFCFAISYCIETYLDERRQKKEKYIEEWNAKNKYANPQRRNVK